MPTQSKDHIDLTTRLLAGDKGALARLITWAENADPRFPGDVHPENRASEYFSSTSD